MRHPYTMLFGLCLVAGAAATGCNSSTNTNEPTTGSSQARVVASSQGSGTTTLHVTATDNADASITVDKTIEVTSGDATVLDLSLQPATYTFNVSIVSNGTDTGTTTAQAQLMDGATTQIALAAQAPQSGGSASSVQIGVDVAPQIKGVSVTASADTTNGLTTSVHVDATSATDDALTFYWSGTGFTAAVQGTDTMSISTATIMAAISSSPMVHVVVQDASGASTTADIALTLSGSSLTGSIASSSNGASAQACLDVQAQCTSACSPGVALGGLNVTVSASCLASCSTALVTCEGN
jgi:hypothetical protein